VAYPLSSTSRLALCAAVSLGLHAIVLATATALLGSFAGQHYRHDARRGPALEVALVAAPPPALALEGLLAPLDEAIGAFSKPPSRSRARPAERARERQTKPETVYYAAREVDVRAVPLADIVPANPDLTGRESGSVVLRLYINAKGTVDNVLIVKAEPYHTFGPALLLPFKQARFLPARKAGIAVNSEMLIELRYAPDEEKR